MCIKATQASEKFFPALAHRQMRQEEEEYNILEEWEDEDEDYFMAEDFSSDILFRIGCAGE